MLGRSRHGKALHTSNCRCGPGDGSAHSRRPMEACDLVPSIRRKGNEISDLERAIPAITQKMLGQQLKAMEADGIVQRTAYPQVPPKVEYKLTAWGQSLCPALDAILKWADRRPSHGSNGTARHTPEIPERFSRDIHGRSGSGQKSKGKQRAEI